jgi:hypothetical protein
MLAPDSHSSSSGKNNVSSFSWSHTCYNSEFLIVWIYSYLGTLTTVTYAGVAMTLLQSAQKDGYFVHALYLLNPTTGANNVVANFSAGTYGGGQAISFIGINTSDPIGTIGTATGTGSSDPTVTIVTESDNSIVVDAFKADNQHTSVVEDDPQIRMDLFYTTSLNTHCASWQVVPTAGSVTSRYVCNNTSNWAMIAVEIKAGSYIDVILRPNARGDLQSVFDGTPYGRADNWHNTNEAVADEDISIAYVGNEGSGLPVGSYLDAYNLDDLSGGGAVHHVSVVVRCRKGTTGVGGGGTGSVAPGFRIASTNYNQGSYSVLRSSYRTYRKAWLKNPNTASEWDEDDFDGLQVTQSLAGDWRSGFEVTTYSTQIYVVISFTAVASPLIELALGQALNTVSPTWTDISADLKRYHTLRGRAHELDRIETGKAEVLLRNAAGNYWRGNTAGDYYPNMKPVTLVRISENFGGTSYRMFYGYVEAFLPGWADGEAGMNPVMELTCVDMFKAFARMNVYPLTGTAGTHANVAPLASDANSGQKLVVLTSVEGLFAGQSVTIADDTPNTELNYIDTIDAATNTVTMLNNLVNNYTTAQNGYVKKYPSVISSQRLKDMLYEKGWPAALTAIDTGLVTIAAMVDAPTGTNVLEHIHDVAKAESGLAFMRGDGYFVFQNRDARQTGDYATSAATLKDDGDTHYVSPELSDDDTLIYNTARVTPDNGNGETQEYFDSTMRDLHGERLWKDENSLIASVGDAIEKALIVVERYKDSILRCSRVELIPANNAADLYPKIFGLGLSRRITLQLDSTQNPALIDTEYHIEGIELTREVGALYKAFWQLWDVKKLLVAPTSYDGYLQKESLVSFADGHDAANADTAYNDAGLVAVGMQKDGAADWLFWRGFLKFDISAIPTSKTALDAIVLVRLNGYFIIDDEFDLTLVDGATLANPIIVNDYGDMIGATTDFGSVTIPTPAIKSARWVGIRLTAAGLADLQTHITAGTGFQKFGVRTSLDITNTAPGGTTNQQYVIFDGKGSNNPARLIVRVA